MSDPRLVTFTDTDGTSRYVNPLCIREIRVYPSSGPGAMGMVSVHLTSGVDIGFHVLDTDEAVGMFSSEIVVIPQ